jgi:hypothetical protein
MRAISLVLCSSVMLMACSTAPIATFTSSGTPGFRISCGGFFGDGDLGSCYSQAGEICKKMGYKIAQTGVNSLIIECKEY